MCLVSSEMIQKFIKKTRQNPVEFFTPLDKAFESCDRKLRYIKHCETHVDWLMISIICLFIQHKTINQNKLSKSFKRRIVFFLNDLKASEKSLLKFFDWCLNMCWKKEIENFNFFSKENDTFIMLSSPLLIQHDYLFQFHNVWNLTCNLFFLNPNKMNEMTLIRIKSLVLFDVTFWQIVLH